MLSMLKNNTTQYAKKKKKKRKSKDLHDDIRGGLPIQFLTLNLSGATKKDFR